MSESRLPSSSDGPGPQAARALASPDCILPVSPALMSPPGRDAPAYELKFLVPEEAAGRVEAWAAAHLALDPHADPALGNAYRTTTLYLDTDARDVLHRRGSHGRRKFRLRRYGREPWIFLERKFRAGGRVRKRRTRVHEAEVPLLAEAPARPDWPGAWFHQRVAAQALGPACLVRYDRTAFVGVTPEGPVRLTLDRRLLCAPAIPWHVEEPATGLPFLEGAVILELKFRAALPALFKTLVHDLTLRPGTVSKYRLGMTAWSAPSCLEGVG